MNRALVLVTATGFLVAQAAMGQTSSNASVAVAPVPSPPAKTLDIGSYTCQDMLADLLNKQTVRMGLSLLIAYVRAQEQRDPASTVYDLAQVRLVGAAVGKSCATGDRSRKLLDVVAGELPALKAGD